MRKFRMDRHGKHYDYVIIQGKHKDPFKKFKATPKLGLNKIKDAGRWRLYQVLKGDAAKAAFDLKSKEKVLQGN